MLNEVMLKNGFLDNIPTYITISWICDICNEKKLSVAWFFCDTIIRYHKTVVVVISAETVEKH